MEKRAKLGEFVEKLCKVEARLSRSETIAQITRAKVARVRRCLTERAISLDVTEMHYTPKQSGRASMPAR